MLTLETDARVISGIGFLLAMLLLRQLKIDVLYVLVG